MCVYVMRTYVALWLLFEAFLDTARIWGKQIEYFDCLKVI
jgi:hypothetical protein